jgi:hypothetical protein
MTDPAIDPATGRRPTAGRPHGLTPEVHDRIVEVVSAGNYLKTAAAFVGISAATLQAWMARGRAAAAKVEAHADGTWFCPACGTDRTASVAVVDEWNAQQDELPQEEGSTPSHMVVPPCVCGSTAAPETWELPASELRFLTFLTAVTQAETRAEVAAVTHWRRSFSEDWRAARDYLARKRPEQWAAKTTIAISTEEAEQRIERATLEALTALGVDADPQDLPGDDDPASLDEPEEL